MKSFNEVVGIIYDMEKVAKSLEIEPFDIYFLGGSACILGQYHNRATMDFDFVDLVYPAKIGRVLRYLSDFDMLEYESTLLAPSYKKRSTRLTQFEYLRIYVLAREDIIVSKIIRMSSKDVEDIDNLILQSNKSTINIIIEEILERDDLYDTKKEIFIENLSRFREIYNV